ncbi:permease prefix domain 1-containing protein [Vagococcus fluvialis]|uniref:permease prefix domain 1-containing protein n=1 Tax=Vagococcus fluvialis TaxID=2738 RepID=UPI003B5CEB8C
MKVIENYVETMFMNLPDTEELNEVKRDILSNMEEKYLELSQQGVSQNEAIGLVISEFGNIDELLGELEVEKNKVIKNNILTLDRDGIDEYIAMKRNTSVGIGFGVILIGIAASLIILGVHFNMVIIGVIFALLVTVISVALFVVNGIRQAKFEYLQKGYLINERDQKYIEIESKNFDKSFVVSLIIGISLFIISSIPVLIGSQQPSNILLFVPMTIIIAVIGCFFVIYGGNVKSGYSFLLENGIDNSISEDELAKRLFWKKFNDNFWLVIVAVYLLISFLFDSWELSWIIFPVAAVLSGIWSDGKVK